MTKQLGLEDYLEALEKMKKSRRDRIGQLGELGVPVTAAVAGGLLAWAIGSASLVSVFGYTFLVLSNPIVWVVGGATVAGFLGYWFAKLARSGGKFDALKDLDIQELEKRIAELRAQADKKWRREPKFVNLISSVQLLVANGRMSQDTATAFIAAVEKKQLTIEDAFRQVQDLALEQKQVCSKGTKRKGGRRFGSWMHWPKLPKLPGRPSR